MEIQKIAIYTAVGLVGLSLGYFVALWLSVPLRTILESMGVHYGYWGPSDLVLLCIDIILNALCWGAFFVYRKRA
jgi:hypothetical protein